MQQWHVPGAVMLVVQDDNVVLEKGYGFADLSKRIPMSPRNTVLRMYSLSKLLTATAIMQLVEQGKLNLDVPEVRQLLDFVESSGRGVGF